MPSSPLSIWSILSSHLQTWVESSSFAQGFRNILRQFSAPHRRKVAFTVALIALSAKMAKADGVVTYEEVEAFSKIVHIPEHERRNVFRLFELAQQDIAGFDTYASQIRDTFNGEIDILSDVLECLFYIAKADHVLHDNEMKFLETISKIFGLSDEHFARKLNRHVLGHENDPYQILGIEKQANQKQIKARYQELVRQYHPDHMLARGLPDDLIALANHRMAMINVAYDQLK